MTSISLGRGLLIGGVVIALMVIIIGYGNDYASCERQGPVRRATNARATRDTGLWANAAKARKESAIRELRLARAVHRFKSPVSKQLENFLRTQAAADHKTAVAYRAYSASSAKDHVRLLDCSSFPPPSH